MEIRAAGLLGQETLLLSLRYIVLCDIYVQYFAEACDSSSLT